MPFPRPLFGLPELADAKRVFVVEGEKCVEAARSIGLTATTSPHGSKSASKADWSPLAGKEIVILPDADTAGQSFTQTAAAMLSRLALQPTIKIVALPGLPEGGDIFDFIQSRRKTMDDDAIRRIVETLTENTPSIDVSNSPVNGSDNVNTVMPVLTCLADVSPTAIEWLWPGRFALGKLSLLVGEHGRQRINVAERSDS